MRMRSLNSAAAASKRFSKNSSKNVLTYSHCSKQENDRMNEFSLGSLSNIAFENVNLSLKDVSLNKMDFFFISGM